MKNMDEINDYEERITKLTAQEDEASQEYNAVVERLAGLRGDLATLTLNRDTKRLEVSRATLDNRAHAFVQEYGLSILSKPASQKLFGMPRVKLEFVRLKVNVRAILLVNCFNLFYF